MSTIKEYRVVLPMTLQEFQVGREWHNLERTKLELQLKSEGRTFAEEETLALREPVEKVACIGKTWQVERGEHSIKYYGENVGEKLKVPNAFVQEYHRLASFIEVFMSGTAGLTEMECWEGFPVFRSVTKNHSMGDKYEMIIEGAFVSDNGNSDNVHNLPVDMLKQREVVLVDIAEAVSPEDYRDGKDPMLFRSHKTGRGPLKPGKWMETQQPVMTCYILVIIKFNCGPFTGYVERKLHDGIHHALIMHHREMYCSIDRWVDFTLAEIDENLKLVQGEFKEKSELSEQLKSKERKDCTTEKATKCSFSCCGEEDSSLVSGIRTLFVVGCITVLLAAGIAYFQQT